MAVLRNGLSHHGAASHFLVLRLCRRFSVQKCPVEMSSEDHIPTAPRPRPLTSAAYARGRGEHYEGLYGRQRQATSLLGEPETANPQLNGGGAALFRESCCRFTRSAWCFERSL